MTNSFPVIYRPSQLHIVPWDNVPFMQKHVLTDAVWDSEGEKDDTLPAIFNGPENVVGFLDESPEEKLLITLDSTPVGFFYLTPRNDKEAVATLYVAHEYVALEPILSSFFYYVDVNADMNLYLDLGNYPATRLVSFLPEGSEQKVPLCEELNHVHAQHQIQHLIDTLKSLYE